METNPDKLYSALEQVNNVAGDLWELADSFRAVGNSYVAESLDFYAKQLATSAKDIRDYDSELLDKRLKDQSEMSNAMFEGIMAVASRIGN